MRDEVCDDCKGTFKKDSQVFGLCSECMVAWVTKTEIVEVA